MAGTIILALISSGVLSTLITALFQYLATKRSQKDGLESKVGEVIADQKKIMDAQKKHEGDIVRVELKMMIADFPDDESDILRLAQHYFKDLHGNWVAAAVFKKWLSDRHLELPNWFEDNE